MSTFRFGRAFLAFAPFWLFLLFFKFGAGIHYSLMSPLGEQVLPVWAVGLVMGGAAFAQFVLDVPAGRILDHFGYRRLLKVAAAIFLLAALCLVLEFTLAAYLLSTLFSVFGWLFFAPGVSAYVLAVAPKEQSGRFLSLRDSFQSVGIVLASALLPFALLLSPSGIGFILAGILLLAFMAISFAPKDRRSAEAVPPMPTPHRHRLRHELHVSFEAIKRLNPASGMLLLLNTASGIFYGTIWFIVPLMVASESDNLLMSIGLGIFDFSVVVLGFALGWLADKVEKRTLVFFGLLIFALCGMLLGFGFGVFFILFGFLATAGEEMAGLSLWSWLHSLDREHAEDGTVASVISLFEDFGWIVGPVAAGILYGIVGPSWTIVIGALPIFILWLAYWLFFAKHATVHLDVSLLPKKPHRRRHKS